MTPVPVRFQPNDVDGLDALAAERRCSRSDIVRDAVRQLLEREYVADPRAALRAAMVNDPLADVRKASIDQGRPNAALIGSVPPGALRAHTEAIAQGLNPVVRYTGDPEHDAAVAAAYRRTAVLMVAASVMTEGFAMPPGLNVVIVAGQYREAEVKAHLIGDTDPRTLCGRVAFAQPVDRVEGGWCQQCAREAKKRA